MQLTCPVCSHVETRVHRAWRLEVCPHCQADGREVYLTDSVAKEPRATVRIHAVTGLAKAAERIRTGETEPQT